MFEWWVWNEWSFVEVVLWMLSLVAMMGSLGALILCLLGWNEWSLVCLVAMMGYE